MKHGKLCCLFLLVLLISSSCKKESVTAIPVSLNYFPVTVGLWKEYTVDSVYHADTDNNNDDSVYRYHFYIREVIDSSYTDNEGRSIQVIRRYKRSDTLSTWNIINVWTQRLSSINAYRTEDNISLHKLSFPINSSITWNANDANTGEEEINYYEYFHEPDIFNNITFDSTTSVMQVNENNYVMKQFGNEIYATGVGLIFKERDELSKKNGVVVSGFEYKMTIRSWGM
jgi:hypothetical protein